MKLDITVSIKKTNSEFSSLPQTITSNRSVSDSDLADSSDNGFLLETYTENNFTIDSSGSDFTTGFVDVTTIPVDDVANIAFIYILCQNVSTDGNLNPIRFSLKINESAVLLKASEVLFTNVTDLAGIIEVGEIQAVDTDERFLLTVIIGKHT